MVPLEDLFISDEEVEYCPLCVEEMDISDKNFKPCPCGYQICQFCYNNIRQNPELNGRCPGCRRLYDDESVEYKTLTAEEYKMQQNRKEKREREKKQREKERKELEIASKRHLAGLRVVQKNLVYVTGLNPPCAPEDLHSVLRLEKYFGQYGRISKIVINRRAGALHASNHGIVVYVTFSKPEDAQRCIADLDGSLCDGRVLRAAHGTTKYCLSYLRGHACPNPNCMFLHEPGEEADSYTRKDLSTHQGIRMGMGGRPHEDETKSPTVSHASHVSNVNTTSNGNVSVGSSTPVHAHVLPATAHWAKAAADSGSPATTSVPMADAAAFPLLGEMAKDRPAKKDTKKPRVRARDATDADAEDVPAPVDAGERIRRMTSVPVVFETEGPALPLFRFDRTAELGDAALARQVVERFLLRPLKKYHLAYAQHPTQYAAPVATRMQQMTLDDAPPGFGREVPSSSSQLLTQLMGK